MVGWWGGGVVGGGGGVVGWGGYHRSGLWSSGVHPRRALHPEKSQR